MSPLHAEYLSPPKRAERTKPADTRRGGGTAQVAAPTWMCLVLSLDDARRARLASITEKAGWRALACGSIGDATKRTERWRTQLAVVDLLGSAGAPREALRGFAKRLADRSAPLLMVCDDESTADELWARQLGVWLYLPAAELGDDLVDLCTEALAATEKRNAAEGRAKRAVSTES